jgi:hypothetical protein
LAYKDKNYFIAHQTQSYFQKKSKPLKTFITIPRLSQRKGGGQKRGTRRGGKKWTPPGRGGPRKRLEEDAVVGRQTKIAKK